MNLKSIFELFGIKGVDSKSEKVLELQKELDLIKSEIKGLSIEFVENINNFRDNEELGDFERNIVLKKKNEFLKSHVKGIFELKKKKNIISKKVKNILKDKRVSDKISELKSLEVYKNSKLLYKGGHIGLDGFNEIIKGITKGRKIKYADTLIFNENQELLILQRAFDAKWCVPGGHVDPGEEFLEAGRRELEEETGINLKESKLQLIGKYEDNKADIEYFRAWVNSNEIELILDESEHRDAKWVKLNDIDDYDFIFNMKENLKKFLFTFKEKVIELKKSMEQEMFLKILPKIIEKAKNHKYIDKRVGKNGKTIYEYERKNNIIKEDNENFINFITKIKDHAERVIRGNTKIKRLSPEEEQGRIKGGKINVEATCLLGASQKSGYGGEEGSDDRQNQLNLLKSYSKESGCFLEDYTEKYNSKNYLDSGAEASVYKIGGSVFKLNNFSQHEDISEFFDRIALQNYIFEGVGYELVGFTEKNNEFCAIVKQPYIIANKSSKSRINEEMKKMNFTNGEGNFYYNENYIIEDLHLGNVLESDTGTLFFIDPIIHLNVEDEGYGGKRVIGEIDLDTTIKNDSEEVGKVTHEEHIQVHKKEKTGTISKADYDNMFKAFDIIESAHTAGKLPNHIFEKAKKDISKLKKIKKLVIRNGKLFFATFFVKNEGLEFDAEKASDVKDFLGDDLELTQGDEIFVKTKKKEAKGKVVGFIWDKKFKTHYIGIYNLSKQKIDYFNTSSLIDFKNLTKETEPILGKPKYKFIKNLGGSTGAELVEDMWGNKFVKKTGKDKEHIKAEYQALLLYTKLGVSVPKVKEFDEENGILYTEFIDGKTLSDSPISEHVESKIKGDFAIDALLGNWDVLGLEKDNIIIDLHNKPFRVDVGGSLNKRAQGEDKEFGKIVTEIDSMLDPKINPQTTKFFAGVDLKKSITKAIGEYEKNKKYINGDDRISNEIKAAIKDRVDSLRRILKKYYVDELPTLNYKGKIWDIDKGFYGEDIYNFYEKVNKDMQITSDDLAILSGTYYATEERALEGIKMWGSTEADYFKKYIKEAKKLGVTYRELFSIIDYTKSSFNVNNVVQEYTSSKTGNINFSKQRVVQNGTSSKSPDFSDKVSALDGLFNPILSAVKTVNHHHSKKLGTSYNLYKMEKFNESVSDLEKYSKDISINPGKYSQEEIESVEYLLSKAKEVQGAINNPEVIISNMVKPKFLEKVKYEKETDKEGIEFKNLMHEGVAKKFKVDLVKVKLLVNGLRKLEDSKNPLVYKKGTFARGISLYDDKLEHFIEQHISPNQYVVHQWGSSSSYMRSGFDTKIKILIHGGGVSIKDISAHRNEMEVLHKPFTLFKTSSLSEDSDKINVVLDKIE